MDRKARILNDIDRALEHHGSEIDEPRDGVFVAAALAVIDRVAGRESTYGTSARDTVFAGLEGKKMAAHGALVALRGDVEHDAMWTLPQLVHQEVFSDVLDAAKHLLASGYKDPAAVMAGCVLEQHLRELARVRPAVSLEKGNGKPKTGGALNDDLAKDGAYAVLTQKRVTAMLDIRNNAAHANWTGFDADQVADLLRDVADFIERHPA